MIRSCSRGTSESLFYPVLQHCLVQDVAATAVPGLIYIPLALTKSAYDKRVASDTMNRASSSNAVSPSLVFLQQLGPEL
jgi:hypothetical protein